MRSVALASALAPALCLAALAASNHAFAQMGSQSLPQSLREIGIDQKLGRRIPLDLSFHDETGREVRIGDYFKDRPVILTMVYYECPMLCTLVLNGLASSLDVLTFDAGREFEIVSVSINPREKPELAAAKKKEYLERYKRPTAAEGWHFLTGDEASIRTLADAVGFHFRWDTESATYAHAAGIMVLTPQGKLARYFYGIEYAPRDLRLALIEASQNRIGSLADQVMLFCYQYDPKTGKYGAAAIGLVRAGGVLTVVLMGAYVLTMFLREHRRARAAATRA